MKKLSRADRKQIEAAIARANRTDKKKKSAQDSIPYERMWPDGTVIYDLTVDGLRQRLSFTPD